MSPSLPLAGVHRVSRWVRLILPFLLAGLALLFLLVTTSYAAPVDLPTAIVYDPAVAAIISQVTTQTLDQELAGLTGEQPVVVAGSLYTITTRHSYQSQAISMATRYVYEQFASAGLPVIYHDYEINGYSLRNVEAEKPGLVDPEEIYLITAHLDDMPSGSIAPGADDNASGSVAVLAVARLLASHDFAYTIRFVLFTGEEQGLWGSAAYAARCAARGENVQGVVNLDMIAYNSDGQPIIDLYGYSGVPASLELTRIFSDVIGVYALDLEPNRFSSGWPIWASDQWSFLQLGYPAFLAIEDMGDSTPHYHQVGDRLSTLDLDYYADYTRAAVATIAHLGRHLETGVLSGTVTALDTGHPMSGAVVGTLASSWQHSYSARTDAAGAYSLTLPVGSYTVTVRPSFVGYYSVVTTQVPILTNTVTVLDVALEPWPSVLSLYLPWIGRE